MGNKKLTEISEIFNYLACKQVLVFLDRYLRMFLMIGLLGENYFLQIKITIIIKFDNQ